jgi:hypothetical protein
VTGLATLSLLEADQTPANGTYKDTVARAIRYLMSAQDSEGCVGPRISQHFMYNHAAATLALVEAFKRTHDESLRTTAQKAVDFCEKARNPYLGWRYGVRDGDNDTSVTGMMMHVLARARGAGLEVDGASFMGGLAWIDKMTDPEFGRVGYQQRGGPPARTMEAMERFPAERSEALTAVALLGRLHARGIDVQRDAFVEKEAALISAKPPRWSPEGGTIDLYYWHWGTEALSRLGGPRWHRWSHALADALLAGQESGKSGDEFGAWPAVDAWSAEGGRVYATALAALTVQRVLAGGSGG